jgi:SAM-dependent methyltransferase
MNIKYVCLGIVRRHIPEKLLFAIMKRRGDGSLAESAGDSYLAMWQEQLHMRGRDFAQQRVLEVGSGRYARFALQMLAAGASQVTLIDLYAEPLDEPSHRAMLARDCERLGLDYGEVCARICVIRADISELPPPPPERQADIVISHAVLEHVRDPKAILACCASWLKPGGLTYHMIDLRDHNLQFQYPFEMLTFPDRIWDRWLDLRGGFHLNRWRASDYLRAAGEAGFVHVGYEPILENAVGLQEVLPRLQERFREAPAHLLAVLSMYLYGEKPCNAH